MTRMENNQCEGGFDRPWARWSPASPAGSSVIEAVPMPPFPAQEGSGLRRGRVEPDIHRLAHDGVFRGGARLSARRPGTVIMLVDAHGMPIAPGGAVPLRLLRLRYL